MSTIQHFSVRSSGRDLSAVRRPRRPEPAPELTSLTKAQLVERAEAAGVDTSGTKAEIVERLTDG